MWIVNNMNMVIIIPGHDPPEPSECLEFANKGLYADHLKLSEV